MRDPSVRPPISQTPFDIPIRRDLRWDFSAADPRFVDDDILINHLWTAFSIGAPGIERFFITALRPLADKIDDPKLRSDMEKMLAQEAMHAATHARFNRALAEKGLSLEKTAAHVDTMLNWIGRNCTQKDMVGMVAAGEHMICSFANLFLEDESLGAAMSPEARRLFDYHMLEEAEHGAVAHDVYRYFCRDNYLHRVKTAAIAAGAILKLVHATLTTLVAESNEEVTWHSWARFWTYGFVKPGLFRLMALRLAHYLNPLYPLSFSFEARDSWRACEDGLYATQPIERSLH
jgi:uncharacterized protein